MNFKKGDLVYLDNSKDQIYELVSYVFQKDVASDSKTIIIPLWYLQFFSERN